MWEVLLIIELRQLPSIFPRSHAVKHISFRTVVRFCPRCLLSLIGMVLLHTLCGARAVLRRRAIRIALRFVRYRKAFGTAFRARQLRRSVYLYLNSVENGNVFALFAHL